MSRTWNTGITSRSFRLVNFSGYGLVQVECLMLRIFFRLFLLARLVPIPFDFIIARFHTATEKKAQAHRYKRSLREVLKAGKGVQQGSPYNCKVSGVLHELN